MIQYVRATRGKHKIHIKYPHVKNKITLCRFCTKFTKSNEEEFKKNPCTKCLKLKESYDEQHLTESIWW